jgi:feruloyl esterase
VAPGSSIEFHESVLQQNADVGPASNWIRLFMARGMAHCSGGEGPDTFDTVSLM